MSRSSSILVCDGGGTRAYLEAKFLDKISTLYTDTMKFDLMLGTSAGALVVSALAKGYTPSFLMQLLREKTPWIFTIRSAIDIGTNDASAPSNKPNLPQKLAMILNSEAFYQAVDVSSNYGDSLLKRLLDEHFGETLITELQKPIILTAYSLTQAKPIIFTNLDLVFDDIIVIKDVKVKDAVMCSMSAPFYFQPYTLQINPDTESQADKIIDGGLFTNSAVLLGLIVNKLINTENKRTCLLSLSTGKNQKEYSPVIGLSHALDCLDITMDTNTLLSNFYSKMLSTHSKHNFFFYRPEFTLTTEYADLDNSTAEYFDLLDQLVEARYNYDFYEIKEFVSRCEDIEANDE